MIEGGKNRYMYVMNVKVYDCVYMNTPCAHMRTYYVCLHVNPDVASNRICRFYHNKLISTHDEPVYLIYNVHINIYIALTAHLLSTYYRY